MYQAARQTTALLYFYLLSSVSLVSTLISTVTTPLLIYSLFSFTTCTYFSRNSVSFDDKGKQSIRICHFGVCYFLSLALFPFLDQLFHYAFHDFLARERMMCTYSYALKDNNGCSYRMPSNNRSIDK